MSLERYIWLYGCLLIEIWFVCVLTNASFPERSTVFINITSVITAHIIVSHKNVFIHTPIQKNIYSDKKMFIHTPIRLFRQKCLHRSGGGVKQELSGTGEGVYRTNKEAMQVSHN